MQVTESRKNKHLMFDVIHSVDAFCSPSYPTYSDVFLICIIFRFALIFGPFYVNHLTLAIFLLSSSLTYISCLKGAL